MAIETRNARIKSTHLGYEDHGIITCVLRLDYGGGEQGFGTHDLAYRSYGIEYIKRILDTIGVRSWEELRGKTCRARAEPCKIHAIGHFLDDKWFNPQVDLAEAELSNA